MSSQSSNEPVTCNLCGSLATRLSYHYECQANANHFSDLQTCAGFTDLGEGSAEVVVVQKENDTDDKLSLF